MGITKIIQFELCLSAELQKENRPKETKVAVDQIDVGMHLLPKNSLYEAIAASLECFEAGLKLTRERQD